MSALAALFLAATAQASAPAPAPAAPATAAPAAPVAAPVAVVAKTDRKICRSIEAELGSRLGGRRVCKLASEWRAEEDESARALRRLDDSNRDLPAINDRGNGSGGVTLDPRPPR